MRVTRSRAQKQQSVLMLHRTRAVGRQARCCSSGAGALCQFGIIAAKGCHVWRAIKTDRGAADSRLTEISHVQCCSVLTLPDPIVSRGRRLDRKSIGLAFSCEASRRLRRDPGAADYRNRRGGERRQCKSIPLGTPSLRPWCIRSGPAAAIERRARSGWGISSKRATATSGRCWYTRAAPNLRWSRRKKQISSPGSPGLLVRRPTNVGG